MFDSAYVWGIISKDVCDFLMVENPRVTCLYLLPKIHKNIKNLPGRLIIYSNGSLCEPLSKFIYSYLKPLVELLASYARDTGDVLKKIASIHLEEDMWKATCDVESLYTSIRHIDGLEAVQAVTIMHALDNDLAKFLLASLRFILTHNFFTFHETLYLQLQRTSMGANCVP